MAYIAYAINIALKKALPHVLACVQEMFHPLWLAAAYRGTRPTQGHHSARFCRRIKSLIA